MNFDRSPGGRLQELVTQGLISENKHPTEDLWIYNYTPACVYSKAWNNLTLQCRGLILAEDGTVIARPFEKFFNVQEHSASDIRWEQSFQLFEKMDGSLGILYKEPKSGRWGIATRGSFQSDQAREGLFMLEQTLWGQEWEPNWEYTYLFEIIYPTNRIVVNYGDRRELVFLCAVHIETGANVFEFGNEWDWPGASAKRHDITDLPIRELHTLELENEEGFVVFFPHNSTRMKTKFSEYVRLHKIITKTNTKNIWQGLKNGDPIEKIIEDTPDEFYGWVKGVIAGLRQKYLAIEVEATTKFREIEDKVNAQLPTGDYRERKKLFAGKAYPHRYSSILFKMWDGDDYEELIWRMVKPDRAEGFSAFNDDEEV